MPPEFGAGVPLRTPVAEFKVIPLGKVPVSVKVGAGKPLAFTVKEPAMPAVKVALLALVMVTQGGTPATAHGLQSPCTMMLTEPLPPAAENGALGGERA